MEEIRGGEGGRRRRFGSKPEEKVQKKKSIRKIQSRGEKVTQGREVGSLEKVTVISKDNSATSRGKWCADFG